MHAESNQFLKIEKPFLIFLLSLRIYHRPNIEHANPSSPTTFIHPPMSSSAETKTKFLPIWVWVIALLQIILVLFFSIGTALNPGDFIPDVSELNYVTQLYITRNVTVAIGIIVALLLKSHKALLLVLLIRVVTDISDVVTVYAMNVETIKSSVPMVVVLLIVPAIAAIGYLWKPVK